MDRWKDIDCCICMNLFRECYERLSQIERCHYMVCVESERPTSHELSICRICIISCRFKYYLLYRRKNWMKNTVLSRWWTKSNISNISLRKVALNISNMLKLKSHVHQAFPTYLQSHQTFSTYLKLHNTFSDLFKYLSEPICKPPICVYAAYTDLHC